MVNHRSTLPDVSTAVRDEVRRVLERTGLLGCGVLVALSGGMDSVCLLGLLAELCSAKGGRLEVAHVDHGLREGAKADAEFCRELAASHGLAFHLRSLSEKDFQRGGSLQAEARRLRRSFLEETRRARRLDAVALGHHADDQAETVLLRLVRGTGPRGIGGMEAWVPPYVRPLLGVRRSEVEEVVAASGWRFREDPTNKNPRYLRNRIRHEVLPLLRELNPSIETALDRFAALVSQDDEWLSTSARRYLRQDGRIEPEGLRLPVAGLRELGLPIRNRVYLAAWEAVGAAAALLEARHLEMVDGLLACDGKQRQAPTPGPASFVRFREDLWVLRPDARVVLEREAVLPGPGRAPLGVFGVFAVWGALPAGVVAVRVPEGRPVGHLALRPQRPGDRMEGKRVKEILADARLPAWRRARVAVLEDGAGILGILGPGFARGLPTPDLEASNQAIWLEEAGEKRWCPRGVYAI